MTYTITITLSIEAKNEEKAYEQIANSTIDELNTGENIEFEPEIIDYDDEDEEN